MLRHSTSYHLTISPYYKFKTISPFPTRYPILFQLKFPQSSRKLEARGRNSTDFETKTIVWKILGAFAKGRVFVDVALTHLLGVSQVRKRGLLYRGRTWINSLARSLARHPVANAHKSARPWVALENYRCQMEWTGGRRSLMRFDGKRFPFPWNGALLSRSSS